MLDKAAVPNKPRKTAFTYTVAFGVSFKSYHQSHAATFTVPFPGKTKFYLPLF
jgi:hypothetical protein